MQQRLLQIRENISELTEVKFRIPPKLKSVNLATRSITPTDLFNCELWFCDPQLLIITEDIWPKLRAGNNFETLVIMLVIQFILCQLYRAIVQVKVVQIN